MSGNSWFVSQQRQRTSRNAILAIFVVALLMSVVSGSFHGKASHQNSYRALGQNDINVIDYDGDLDSIIQLAQEIADRESAADVVTELPPDQLNEEDSTTLSCPGQETFSDMQQIQYTYSMTLYPESDLDDVRNQFVVKLNEYLAMQLLDCENPSRKLRKRKLEGGIAVAVNTQRGTSSSSEYICKRFVQLRIALVYFVPNFLPFCFSKKFATMRTIPYVPHGMVLPGCCWQTM